MYIINQTKKIILADKAKKAKGFLARAKGLIGLKSFFQENALIIPRCQAIHMFFMRFSIDVIFVDRRKKVVGLVQNIKPFQLSPFFLNACCALELPSGVIERTNTSLGDQILINEIVRCLDYILS